MIVPHEAGIKVVEIKFDMFSDLKADQVMEKVEKNKMAYLDIPTDEVKIQST